MGKFMYLGSIAQTLWKIVEDVASRIKCGWMKWQEAMRVLCYKKVPSKVKEKFYKNVVRPARMA